MREVVGYGARCASVVVGYGARCASVVVRFESRRSWWQLGESCACTAVQGTTGPRHTPRGRRGRRGRRGAGREAGWWCDTCARGWSPHLAEAALRGGQQAGVVAAARMGAARGVRGPACELKEAGAWRDQGPVAREECKQHGWDTGGRCPAMRVARRSLLVAHDGGCKGGIATGDHLRNAAVSGPCPSDPGGIPPARPPAVCVPHEPRLCVRLHACFCLPVPRDC